jgi:hypothetical protein
MMSSSPCPTPFELSQVFLAPSGDPRRQHFDVCESCALLARLSTMAQQLPLELPSAAQREATRTALLSRSAPAMVAPRGWWVVAASGLFLVVISAFLLWRFPNTPKPLDSVEVSMKGPEPQASRPKESVAAQQPAPEQKRMMVEHLSRIKLAAYRNPLFFLVAETFSLYTKEPATAPIKPRESLPKERPPEPLKEALKEDVPPNPSEYEAALQEAATALRNNDLILAAERFGYAADQ